MPPLPAGFEVRPFTKAGNALTHRRAISPRHPFIQQNSLDRNSNLTPGITRRPASPKIFDSRRVGGRVHAVVMLRREMYHAASHPFLLPL
jgi:hypothetical protein